MHIRHLDLDVGGPLPHQLEVPDGVRVEATVWLHGRPLGKVAVGCRDGVIDGRGLVRAIVDRFADPIVRQLVRDGLATPGATDLGFDRLLSMPAVEPSVDPGLLTVAVCTDGRRPERLRRCLAALRGSGLPPAEIIVVRHGAMDSPGESGTAERDDTPSPIPVRWIVEPGADLARARGAAIDATRTPLVAFIDESVRVDPHWTSTVCRTFRDYPDALAVVGSVLPDGVESEASRLRAEACDRMAWGDPFGFRWLRLAPGEKLPREWLNACRLGSASNMAFRTEAFRIAGGFEAIAGGSAGDSGQHLDLWLRLLEARCSVIREPAASGREGGVASIGEAKAEVQAAAAGVSAALVAAAVREPGRILPLLLLAQWFLRTSLADVLRSRGDARSISMARWRGHVAGTWAGLVGALRRGRRRPTGRRPEAAGASRVDAPFERGRIVPIELARPWTGLGEVGADGDDANATLEAACLACEAEILATWHGQVVGTVRAVTGSRSLTLEQVRRLVVDRHHEVFLLRHLGLLPALREIDGSSREDRVREAIAAARTRLLGHLRPAGPVSRIDERGTVSIVVPTMDRPDNLRACLESILAQRTDRRVEIVVVDNHPESGLAVPVVAEFKGVRLVSESRKGSSYARNRGLLACRGSIAVLCDDDVVVPAGWLEKLLAGFDDPKVGVVTGNILPWRLGTAAERLCEATCSLSRGSEPFTVDGDWFRTSRQPVQGWDFGTTASAAVRMEVFRDGAVGLFAESLGPGTPVGAGEDPYFIYRVLKAGYRLRYEPDAWVWHRHRDSFRSLRRQVYAYAKSAVSYHLMTLVADGDRRACASLFGGLQRHYLRRLLAAVRGQGDVPARLVLVEIAGHLMGGFSFLHSDARRRRLARDPAHPPMPPALPRSAEPAEADGPWVFEGSGADRGPRAGSRRRAGRLPQFLVIGAQKAGTTALDLNLRKHPGIELVPNFRSRLLGWENTKETWFFNGVGDKAGVVTLDDYRALFNDNAKLQGEVCPTYDRPGAVASIAGTIPDAKLIFICREPVARFESALNHMMQWYGEYPELDTFCQWSPARPFHENLQAELEDDRRIGLLRMGIYADSVERVLRRFPRDRLLLLVAEEYRLDPQSTYDRIFDFLGLPRQRIDHQDAHVREYTNRLTPGQREWLADFYRPHNERFFGLFGREISSWSVDRLLRAAS